MANHTDSVPELIALAQDNNWRAVGRLLTLVERGGAAADEVAHLTHTLGTGAHVVGITGAPGAGKSTLTGQLIRELADAGHKPAVLAVDPSSPLTGGAILGDRIRMDGISGNKAFIRSVATRGHAGGLALSVPGCVRVFDAAGFNPILIETVGVGQVEVDVAGAADTTVVVVNPGWGDAVQANKAGLMEVADVFVVNKADRPGANDTRRDLELMLDLSHVSGAERDGYRPPILLTTATDGTGASQLWDAVEAHFAHLKKLDRLVASRVARLRQEVVNRAEQRLAEHLHEALDGLVIEPTSSPAELTEAAIAAVTKSGGGPIS